MVKKVVLNLNNQKVILRSGQEISKLKSKEEKILYSIFDSELNKDGKLDKDEVDNEAKEFIKGTFNLQMNDKSSKLTYIEDADNDGKPEYTQTWILNKNGDWIERIKDLDGDGNIDEHYTRTYHENGQVSRQTEEYFSNGHLDFKTTLVMDENGDQVGIEDEYHADDAN